MLCCQILIFIPMGRKCASSKIFFLFLGLFALFNPSLCAIPHITVTPQPRKNEGLFIPSTILTQKSLEKTQHTFVGSAVRQTPGVTSLSTGTEGSVNHIKFRGLDSSHTLVVIDGIPVNDPSSYADAFDFGIYRSLDLKTVSILPGSQSLLYGSNAIGGVVVMETLTGEGDPTVSFTQEGGSYHLAKSHVQSSGQLKRFDYFVAGERYRIGEGSIWNRRHKIRQSDDYHDTTGTVKVGYQANACFHITGYYTASQDDFKNNIYDFAKGLNVESKSFKTKSTSKLGYVRLNWQATEKAHHLTTLSRLDTTRHSCNQGLKDRYDGSRTRLHHQTNYRLTPQNLIQVSAEHEGTTLQQHQQSLHHVYQNHLAGTYEYKPHPIVTLGAGVRHTHHKTFKNHTSYQLSGKLHFKTTEVFASFGTGFRAPSLLQIYGSTASNATILPNKDLKPETSQGFDGGVEQTFDKLNSKVRFTYFIIHVNNIIAYQREGATSRFRNVHQRITHGLEGKWKTDFTPSLSTQLTYTYTRGVESNTKRHPLKVPQHKVGLALYYCPQNWSNFVEGTYHAKTKDFNHTQTGAYFILRAGIGYEVNTHFKVFGRVENILDRVYEQTYGYATRGRAFVGGLKIKI